jgi:hypothetical protein
VIAALLSFGGIASLLGLLAVAVQTVRLRARTGQRDTARARAAAAEAESDRLERELRQSVEREADALRRHASADAVAGERAGMLSRIAAAGGEPAARRKVLLEELRKLTDGVE